MFLFFLLKGAHVGYDDEDDITFTIKVDDKTFHLQARNLDEREKWVSKIEELIELHSNFTLLKDSVSRSSVEGIEKFIYLFLFV